MTNGRAIPNPPFQARTKLEIHTQEQDELSFPKDVLVTGNDERKLTFAVIELDLHYNDGWFTCEYSDQTGLIHRDYLDILVPPSSAATLGIQQLEQELDSILQESPSTWTPIQVSRWLDSSGFGHLIPNFNGVTGAQLLSLSLAQLRDELKVELLKDRIGVLHEVLLLGISPVDAPSLTAGDTTSPDVSDINEVCVILLMGISP